MKRILSSLLLAGVFALTTAGTVMAHHPGVPQCEQIVFYTADGWSASVKNTQNNAVTTFEFDSQSSGLQTFGPYAIGAGVYEVTFFKPSGVKESTHTVTVTACPVVETPTPSPSPTPDPTPLASIPDTSTGGVTPGNGLTVAGFVLLLAAALSTMLVMVRNKDK